MEQCGVIVFGSTHFQIAHVSLVFALYFASLQVDQEALYSKGEFVRSLTSFPCSKGVLTCTAETILCKLNAGH